MGNRRPSYPAMPTAVPSFLWKRTMPKTRSLLLCLLILLVSFATPAKQPVRGLVIDRLDVRETAESVSLRVRFNFPVIYVRHFPQAAGDSLQIVVRAKPDKDVPMEYLRMRESARVPESLGGLVHAVRYEGDHPGLPWIVVDFRGEAHYRVRPGRDARSLVILIDATAPRMDEAASSSRLPRDDDD